MRLKVGNTCFTSDESAAIPLIPVRPSRLSIIRDGLGSQQQRWVEASGFTAEPGTICIIGDSKGNFVSVLGGFTDDGGHPIWDWAQLAKSLPPAIYRIISDINGDVLSAEKGALAALGWGLNDYSFNEYKTSDESGHKTREKPILVWPENTNNSSVLSQIYAISLIRDLINTPASDLGPAEFVSIASDLAKTWGADISVIKGDDLLEHNYPAIHAVGRASDRAPCLIDMVWGNKDAPKVTLVGKGVCFDTGGLDLKSSSGMKLMKKDMGGSAHVLGLAALIVEAELPIRLRILIPAVENSIDGSAIRPSDVIFTRKGLTIEIGNTDAEGRVILADALTEAASEHPDLIIDCATLTGAARIALGADIPALFCNDDKIASSILASSEKTFDPLWRMPLWHGYNSQVDGKVADVNNSPDTVYGGAITAALFLERFIQPVSGREPSWVHIDMMAWNLTSRPGRPEGGEAMGLRALFSYLQGRYCP